MNSQLGLIEVIVGGMYSGKTEELIRRLRRSMYARQKIQVFKPIIDNRSHAEKVASHDQNFFAATAVRTASDIFNHLHTETEVIGIDEGQFFDHSLVDICTRLAEQGRRVLVAGLDTDWLAKPFGPMPELMAIADLVTKQHAVCVVCGGLASRTQRVSESSSDRTRLQDQVLVGSHGMYEARCRKHFRAEVLPAHTPELHSATSEDERFTPTATTNENGARFRPILQSELNSERPL